MIIGIVIAITLVILIVGKSVSETGHNIYDIEEKIDKL